MRPLHIVQLGPVPPPEGGVSRNMRAIGDELERSGHRCTFIATTKGPPSSEPNVFRPRSPIALIRTLRSMEFDVLHLHLGGDITPRVIALALACAVFGGKRKVLTIHSGAFPLSPLVQKARPFSIAGNVFRRFSKLIAVNDAIADAFHKFGVAKEKVEVISPFVLSRPDPNIELSTRLRDAVAGAEPLLVSVGGLEADYQPMFLVEAMPKLLERFPKAVLILVGDGSLRTQVEARIADLGLSAAVVPAGNVPHNETLHLIDKADVLLRTTLFDGDAISVREALHLGTPVVATDNGMRPKGVFLIRNGDAEGLFDAVERSIAAGKCESSEKDDGENIRKVVELYVSLSVAM